MVGFQGGMGCWGLGGVGGYRVVGVGSASE